MARRKSMGDKFKIFIVDDEENLIEAVKGSYYGSEIYSVVGCSDPIEAIEIIKNNDFDLLITDFQMYPINGDELVRRVRVFNPNIYILFLTGYADGEPPEEVIEKLDIQGYCEKSSISQLKLWVESSRKIVTSNKRFEEINNKLKLIIDFTPEIYSQQAPYNVLNLVLKQSKLLFNVEDAFIVADDIVNMKFGNKLLFKGIGKFDIKLEDLKKDYPEIYMKVGQVKLESEIESEIDKNENSIMFSISNEKFKNLGVVYIENYKFDFESQIMEIFISQLASSLNNIFLYQLAVTDDLTGLYNRVYINNYLMKYTFSGQFTNSCIMMMDIDDFKHVNDSYGHQVGDKILRSTAQLIKKQFRETDLVSRYGGEEFIAILTDTEINDAKKAAEKLRIAIEQNKISLEQFFVAEENMSKEEKISITISIGVTEFRVGDTWDDMIKRADSALYKVKSQGKNGYIVI